jgi:hypothetical protein
MWRVAWPNRRSRRGAAAAPPKSGGSRLLVALALVLLPVAVVAVDRIGVAPSTDACTVIDRRHRPPQSTFEWRCVSHSIRGCVSYVAEPVTRPPSWELVVAWPEPAGGSATLVVSETVGSRLFERDTVWVHSRVGRFSGHHYDARIGGHL